MAEETDIYNSSDPGGGGGGGDSYNYDLKISKVQWDAANPITMQNGILSVDRSSYQFSQPEAIDISDLVECEINLRLKFQYADTNKRLINKWYGLGDNFLRVSFSYANNFFKVYEAHFADAFNSWRLLNWAPTIYEDDINDKWIDVKFVFNVVDKFAQFFLNGVASTKATFTRDVYKNTYALCVGGDSSSLNSYGVNADMMFDLKNTYVKKNGVIIWGNEVQE